MGAGKEGGDRTKREGRGFPNGLDSFPGKDLFNIVSKVTYS